MKKVSLICTVFNEGKNIEEFIKSISRQLRIPNEFIIVDGGSTDNTYSTAKEVSKNFKWIRIYQIKGANISQGRNYAIKKSKYDIIASIDAGGIYDKNWLRNLLRGFNGEVSFGIDKPLIKNNFQKVLAKSILHKNVPGSSRNMMFSKVVWKKVGGYPEDMERAEDTLFDQRIRKAGYKISSVKDAICYWEMRKNISEVRKQFYGYGYWDGILQRKYNLLPKRYILLVWILGICIPFYPFLFILSRPFMRFKIDFDRRYSYFFGYILGYFGRKK